MLKYSLSGHLVSATQSEPTILVETLPPMSTLLRIATFLVLPGYTPQDFHALSVSSARFQVQSSLNDLFWSKVAVSAL